MRTLPDNKLKVDIYNLEQDYEIIYPHYCKYYNFENDVNHLPFNLFDLRVLGLDELSNLFSLRYRVLTGGKIEDHEKPLVKTCLNQEQKEYKENKTSIYIPKTNQSDIINSIKNNK